MSGLLEECRTYVLVSIVMASIRKKIGPKNMQHGACLTEGSKTIWAMPKYTDHFSKRGFPNFDLLFIGKCNTVMFAIKQGQIGLERSAS